jgi:PBSX family phage terminase large subunit
MTNKQKIDKLLTEKQQEVLKDIFQKKPMHMIFHGAIRSGKTHLGIIIWDMYLRRFKKKKFVMTGYTVGSLQRNVLDPWIEMFGVEAYLNAKNEFYVYGNKVCCFGADKSDSWKAMRGITSQAWYANEIILQHQNTVKEAMNRCSEDDAFYIWETNPDKPSHYVKKDFIDKSGSKFSDGSYNILSYHFELFDNTFLSQKYIEKTKSDYPAGVMYDRQILGKWKVTDSAILTNLKVIPDPPLEHSINDYCYGLDFGFNHPTAMVKNMYVDGDLYVELQFCDSKLISSDIVRNVRKCVSDKNKPIYCDGARPEIIKELQDEGFNAIAADKSPGSVLKGINKLKEYNNIYLVYNPILIRQCENYEWKKNAQNEALDEPVKIDDDCPDAIRYADYTHSESKVSFGDDSFIISNVEQKFKY